MSPLIWKAETSPKLGYIDNKTDTFKFGMNPVVFFLSNDSEFC